MVTATAVFAQLQYSLNRIFNVHTKRGIVSGWFYKRLMSLLMVLAIGAVVVGSIVVNCVVSLVFHGSGRLPEIINLAISVVVFTVIFVIMFRVLPDVEISWKDTVVGALISGVLFVAGGYAIGQYLAYSGTESVYGAAASLALLLLWVFYSALVVFLARS